MTEQFVSRSFQTLISKYVETKYTCPKQKMPLRLKLQNSPYQITTFWFFNAYWINCYNRVLKEPNRTSWKESLKQRKKRHNKLMPVGTINNPDSLSFQQKVRNRRETQVPRQLAHSQSYVTCPDIKDIKLHCQHSWKREKNSQPKCQKDQHKTDLR